MNKKLTPRYIIIAIILAWAIYALWPSISFQQLSEDKKETLREEGKLRAIESKIIKQGLDLKGGMYIVLEVDLPTLISGLAINKDKNLENTLSKVTERLNEPDADFFNLFTSISEEDNLRLARYFHEYGASTDEIIGKLRDESDDAINRVLEILQNRVDQFGVAEPTIQKQGSQRIIVELAGIQDSERARDLLQSTALLEFYLVKDAEITQDMLTRIDNILKGNEDIAELAENLSESIEPQDADIEQPVSDDKTITVSELFGDTEQELAVTEDTSVVVDQRLFEESPFSSLLRNFDRDLGVPESNVYAVNKILALPEVEQLLESTSSKFSLSHKAQELTDASGNQVNIYRLYHLEGEPELTGGVISDAKENISGTGSDIAGQPVVLVEMNSDGTKQWSRITGANINRRIAIVLDNKVHMAPNIIEKIPSGGTRIQGFADLNEAKDIAIVLRAGALPVPVQIIEERIVGPSLGADSIRQGTRSVIIGLVIVMIFMLVYYKIAGSIANFALIWNMILVLSILALLQATLTLPGIAALILTMGMSIDANVIIFERIREELRKGKTARAAIDAGYNRALTTIVDANITTVIAALVLYQFGTGPIKGFATVLFWGIAISMFTAIFVTRTIFMSMTNRKNLQKLSI
jgi:SecD/SecF fusion protein